VLFCLSWLHFCTVVFKTGDTDPGLQPLNTPRQPFWPSRRDAGAYVSTVHLSADSSALHCNARSSTTAMLSSKHPYTASCSRAAEEFTRISAALAVANLFCIHKGDARSRFPIRTLEALNPCSALTSPPPKVVRPTRGPATMFHPVSATSRATADCQILADRLRRDVSH
jgi:hypothetical protein